MEIALAEASARRPSPVPASTLDAILTAQIVVAWAGEGHREAEESRLGWWNCDLASEFGGEDLFRRLLPHTWRWATLEAVREAARRVDARMRSSDHDPDALVSLFHLGFELDERLDERLLDLKRGVVAPAEALPGLGEVVAAGWDRAAFAEWVDAHAGDRERVHYSAAPGGRRLAGDAPADPERLVRNLVAALAPMTDAYPLPHYRRSR